MGSYRCFFRGRSGAIQGRDDFEANDDVQAMVLAELLGDACSDICDTFELWQGARRVSIPHGKTPSPSEITASAQESLILREELIRDSHWMIARSKRLLEQLEKLNKIAPRTVQSDNPNSGACSDTISR